MKMKQFAKNVVYAEKFTGTYSPRTCSMKIKDGNTPTVMCTDSYAFSTDPEKLTSYKFSKEGIERIRELMNNAKYLFNEAPLEENRYVVLDGQKEEYFFRSGDKEAYIKEDNFSSVYSEMPRDTKAGEILSIVDSIHEILKEYGIDPDEEDEEPDDEDE